MDSRELPVVTVVLAVYETEEYFERCVNSIINCDYKNLEIILVDDGSPDNCPKLCDEYAKKDCRIRVVHKENGGCHTARNTGISLATGKYIVFCDSDDYVPQNAYSILVQKMIETDADVVQGTLRRTRTDGGDVRLWKKSHADTLLTKIIGFPSAIYRTEMLKSHHIEFIPYRMGEDNGFMIQVMQFAEKVEYIDDVTYEYVVRSANAKTTSAIMMTDFVHYYDDLRWRRWTLEYINNSKKLKKMGQGHLGEFCMVVDERWFHFIEEERQKNFEELKVIANAIDWEQDVQNAIGYLQVDNKQLQQLSLKQYEKHLRLEFKIKRPIRKLLKRG